MDWIETEPHSKQTTTEPIMVPARLNEAHHAEARRGWNWTVTLVFLFLLGLTALMAFIMRLVFSSITT